MIANPKDKYNEGIKLVCDNSTGQVGLSYMNGTVVVMAPFSYIPGGYFGKNLQVNTLVRSCTSTYVTIFTNFGLVAGARRQRRLLPSFRSCAEPAICTTDNSIPKKFDGQHRYCMQRTINTGFVHITTSCFCDRPRFWSRLCQRRELRGTLRQGASLRKRPYYLRT